MYLTLVIKQITETVAGGVNSASIAKRIASLEREANIQREEANIQRENANTNAKTSFYEKLSDTQLDTECDDGAGAPLTVLEKNPNPL